MATVTLSTVHSKVQDLEDAIEQLTSTILGDTANNSLNRKLQKQSNLLLNKNIQLKDQQKTISKLEKLVIYLSNIPGTSADDIWRPSRKVRKERGRDQMWEMLTKQLHTIMLKQPVGLKVYEEWTEEDSELSRQEVDCYISALTNYLQNNRRLTNPPPPAYTLFINTVNYYILNHHITFSQLLTFMLLSIYSMTCLLKLQHIRMLMVLHFSFNSDISFKMRKDTIIKKLNNFIWWDPADPATKEELTRLMTFNCPCPRHKTLRTPPDFTTFAAQAPRWSAIQKMTQPGEDFIVYCQLQHKINLYFEKHCDLTSIQKTDVQPPKACESKASKRKATLANQEDTTPKQIKLTKKSLERTVTEEKLTHHTAATNYSEDTEPYCDVENNPPTTPSPQISPQSPPQPYRQQAEPVTFSTSYTGQGTMSSFYTQASAHSYHPTPQIGSGFSTYPTAAVPSYNTVHDRPVSVTPQIQTQDVQSVHQGSSTGYLSMLQQANIHPNPIYQNTQNPYPTSSHQYTGTYQTTSGPTSTSYSYQNW